MPLPWLPVSALTEWPYDLPHLRAKRCWDFSQARGFVTTHERTPWVFQSHNRVPAG
jgi:hypothetical protein